jgi:anti-sigma28 factor (negative regulator of flagellin synthesis)
MEKDYMYRDDSDNSSIHVGGSGRQSVVMVSAQSITSQPEFRERKVLDIRRQLREGRYDLDKRLDAAMDRVLRELRE